MHFNMFNYNKNNSIKFLSLSLFYFQVSIKSLACEVVCVGEGGWE